MLRKFTAAAAALALSTSIAAGAAFAADIKPAVVFDMGGKFDKSFNEGVFNGVEKFKKETGVSYREFEVTNETQREQALRRMAQRGADPVIGVGFAQAPALEKVAKEFPNTRFAIIDSVVDLPNVRSVVFKEHEGSFLVGMIAALKSESGKVGFVGGMDIPLIRKFACGYEQGAKHVSGDTEVLQNMTGTTPAAWNDPTRGSVSSPRASSAVAWTWSMPPPAAPASGSIRPPRISASSPSASIPTRTICSRAPCSPPC